jgi:hypothetical protein
MQQLEISFFWPLTEQISLDLDFTPSEEWIADWRKKQWTGAVSGNVLIANGGTGIGAVTWSQPVTPSLVIKPTEKHVGKWQITEHMFVYRPTKPNVIIRFMAKFLLGFKWIDEV